MLVLMRWLCGPPDEVMSMDQSLLKIILQNHVLKNKVLLGQLYNGQRLETIAGKFLRVFIYRTVGPSHRPRWSAPPSLRLTLTCPAKPLILTCL